MDVIVVPEHRNLIAPTWRQFETSVRHEYASGETFVLRSNDKAEMHTIRCVEVVDGFPVLILCEDVTAEFSAENSWIQKTHNRQVIHEVLIGNPDHLHNYPAITIEAKDMAREPLTLGSVSDMYNYEIAVWQDATTCGEKRDALHTFPAPDAPSVVLDGVPMTLADVRIDKPAETERLAAVFERGISAAELAKRRGVTSWAIRQRATKLGGIFIDGQWRFLTDGLVNQPCSG